MTKARDLANLISGGFTEADIPNLSASKITSGTFADARIAASNVSQHAQSFDDNKIVNDISTLGLRVHTQENLNASNTNSASFDVFQDASGITNLTNCARDTNEFISSVSTESNTNLLMTFESSQTGLEGADADSYTASIGSGSGTLNSTTKKYGTNSLQISNAEYLELTPASGDLFGDASNTDFTIEFWFRYIGRSTGDYPPLFVKGSHSGNQYDIRAYWGYQSTSNHYMDVAVVGGNYGITGTGHSNVSSQFNHYAYVRDGATLRMYFNGVQQGSNAGLGTNNLYDAYSTFRFGKSFVGGNVGDMSGYYDNIRFSNIARYPNGTTFTPPAAQFSYQENNATGSFEGNAITASSTNKMGAVITYQDNAGTNTLNTDIILKLSADNGSNYSTATLTALPDFATGIKMAKVNDLSVTAGTQLKYKIEFANQASGSKEARIRGVSLQY